MKFKFESIDNITTTDRAMVPGGWLVRTFEAIHQATGDGVRDCGYFVAMVFVPEPDHSWTIDNDEVQK